MKANENLFSSGETYYLALLETSNSKAPSVPVNAVRRKYFPSLAKQPDEIFTMANGIRVTQV